MYKLKQGVQGFTVIDGPMAKKSFKQGETYAEIPPQEAAKFEEIKDDQPEETAETVGKPKKASKG